MAKGASGRKFQFDLLSQFFLFPFLSSDARCHHCHSFSNHFIEAFAGAQPHSEKLGADAALLHFDPRYRRRAVGNLSSVAEVRSRVTAAVPESKHVGSLPFAFLPHVKANHKRNGKSTRVSWATHFKHQTAISSHARHGQKVLIYNKHGLDLETTGPRATILLNDNLPRMNIPSWSCVQCSRGHSLACAG